MSEAKELLKKVKKDEGSKESVEFIQLLGELDHALYSNFNAIIKGMSDAMSELGMASDDVSKLLTSIANMLKKINSKI